MTKNNKTKFKEIIKIEVSKKDFLLEVRGRLENDVGTYLEMREEKRRKEMHIGYWGLNRLLFPVIESVASTLRINKYDLLEKLGVEYPMVAWEMFRNSLSHTDNPRVLHYKNHTVKWGLMINGFRHCLIKNHYSLDLKCLYVDLLKYLESEIKNSEDEKVLIEKEVHFYDNAPKRLIEEIMKIDDQK